MGKTASPETRARQSIARKNRITKDETREKLRAAFSGEKNPMYGTKMSPEHKEKLRRINAARTISPETCEKHRLALLGRHHTPETLEKMSRAQVLRHQNHPIKPETRQKMSMAQRGEKSFRWRGGTARQSYAFGFTCKLKNEIRVRDGFTCFVCGGDGGGYPLVVHHIDYNKTNHHPSNLVTLCNPCHSKTNSRRESWVAYFKPTFGLEQYA